MVEIKYVKENLQIYRLSDHLTVMYDGFLHEVIIVFFVLTKKLSFIAYNGLTYIVSLSGFNDLVLVV